MFLLYFVFTYLIFGHSKLVEPFYNYGNQQNYEIDLLYNHILGQNLYFINKNDDDDEKTQFSVTLYPSLGLETTFKFYTNETKIIDALENGKMIFFGLDLNITNTDITLENYNTDIIGCELTKQDTKCYDYVYDTTLKRYMRNENAIISKNNLIPLGYDEITLNLLTEHVIGYKHYYSVSFTISYPEKFDNITMFNWVNYVANDMEHSVTGFYGIVDSSSDWNTFSENNLEYYGTLAYADGAGLSDEGVYLSNKILFFILCFFIVYF